MEKLFLSTTSVETLKASKITAENRKDLMTKLLALKDISEPLKLVIVELSRDGAILTSETPNNPLYKGQGIDVSGICHNTDANEIIVKNFTFIECQDLLAQAKILSVAPAFDNKEKVEIRQKINQDLVKKLSKISEKTPNCTFIRLTFVYVSTVGKNVQVTKTFYDTTPFQSAKGELLLEVGSTYQLELGQISGGDISINSRFYEKHKTTWGVYPTSPHNYLSIKQIVLK